MNSEPPSALLPASPQIRLRGRQREAESDPGRVARRAQLALLVNRAIDVVVSAAGLVVLALPMLAIGVLVKLTSPGPAIYRQTRTGLGGKPFTMYKYRTMWVDAEATWATKRGDPRCTPFGHLLRRWCLDELPQLYNVLRGEMSLVGPRPEQPRYVSEFCRILPEYDQRHQVAPGITGWAQINGWRGVSSLEKRLAHDLHYVRHWSLGFNLRILLLTPFRILANQDGS